MVSLWQYIEKDFFNNTSVYDIIALNKDTHFYNRI